MAGADADSPLRQAALAPHRADARRDGGSRPPWTAYFVKLVLPLIRAASEAACVSIPERSDQGGLASSTLMTIGLYALALAPFMGAAFFLRDYLQGRVTWQLVVDLRNAICRALMPQALSYFENRRSGDLMSRITNDVGKRAGRLQPVVRRHPRGPAYISSMGADA